MTLLEAQQRFAHLLPRLLSYAHLQGFQVTLGETYRPQETAELYALQGRGAKGSLHPLQLAIDIHLFLDGVFLTHTEDHTRLGRYWESLDSRCVWGGRFKRADGNHYQLTWKPLQ